MLQVNNSRLIKAQVKGFLSENKLCQSCVSTWQISHEDREPRVDNLEEKQADQVLAVCSRQITYVFPTLSLARTPQVRATHTRRTRCNPQASASVQLNETI